LFFSIQKLLGQADHSDHRLLKFVVAEGLPKLEVSRLGFTSDFSFDITSRTNPMQLGYSEPHVLTFLWLYCESIKLTKEKVLNKGLQPMRTSVHYSEYQ